jgi:hypothetical protein
MKPWHWIALGAGIGVFFLWKKGTAVAAAQTEVDKALPVGDCQDNCYKKYANYEINDEQLTACVKGCGTEGL